MSSEHEKAVVAVSAFLALSFVLLKDSQAHGHLAWARGVAQEPAIGALAKVIPLSRQRHIQEYPGSKARWGTLGYFLGGGLFLPFIT